jgi:hypothetical protein
MVTFSVQARMAGMPASWREQVAEYSDKRAVKTAEARNINFARPRIDHCEQHGPAAVTA